MPLVSFRTEVQAPASVVWQIMKEKIARPDIYVPGVERVELVRHLGPHTLERAMHADFGTHRARIHEFITWDDPTMTVLFKLHEDPRFTGFITNTVFDEGGRVELDYTMNWVPRSASPSGGEPDWQAVIRAAVLHAQKLAEERAPKK